MHIITVIPIVKGTIKSTLTYFTKQDIAVGSIVSIPLRNKKVFGLVVGKRDVEGAKSEIKSLSYSMKKIDNIQASKFLTDTFIESVQLIADYYASNIGSVLFSLLPSSILEKSSEISYTPRSRPSDTSHETVLLQSDDEERYATYKSLIREEFARGHSVFFCMPTTEDLKFAKHTLEKGIETYTFTLHSLLSKKQMLEVWQQIIECDHPVLIIATGLFLSVPRDDLGTIILEKESSRAYKMQSRPFADMRTVAEIVAKSTNRRLVLGDTLLRTETLWEGKNGRYPELSPLKFRSLSTSECRIVDMKTPEDQKKKEFAILSDTLKQILTEAKENNENTFLFCGRKGLYPITVCSDCGTVVACNNCNAPVVLYGHTRNNDKGTSETGNLFVCHHCGERRDSYELCVHCKSWRLTPLGIGTENVVTEIKKLFPDTTVFLMDKEHTKTHKQAIKDRDLFYASPGSIMVGTEMALTYLNQKVENTAVVSIDSFFSIPDFRINEKVFQILLSLRTLSEKNMIIQTRKVGTKIFEYAVRGNLMDFYRDEIAERKAVDYPPFTTFIKLTLVGEKTEVKKRMTEIVEELRPYEVLVFDAFTPGSQKKFTVHGLITLPKGKWVDVELLQKLRSLPPYCSVKVDPDSVL